MDHSQMQMSTSLNHINNITLQNMVRKNGGKSAKSRGTASANVSFGYAPSSGVKAKTVPQFQARLAKTNPAAAKDLGAQFRKYDYDSI